jgi:hypothetical protein
MIEFNVTLRNNFREEKKYKDDTKKYRSTHHHNPYKQINISGMYMSGQF